MKITVLGLVCIILFAVTGVALAMPKLEVIPPLSEAAMMFLLGMFLTGASFLGRKLWSDQRSAEIHKYKQTRGY